RGSARRPTSRRRSRPLRPRASGRARTRVPASVPARPAAPRARAPRILAGLRRLIDEVGVYAFAIVRADELVPPGAKRGHPQAAEARPPLGEVDPRLREVLAEVAAADLAVAQLRGVDRHEEGISLRMDCATQGPSRI